MILREYKLFELWRTKRNLNPFDAVNRIAATARHRANSVDNRVLHSEAFSWCLSGTEPRILQSPILPPDNVRELFAYMHELLIYVDDNNICDSVRSSVYHSFKSSHLIYVYSSQLEYANYARVRILTNIIWLKFQPGK